MTEEERKHRERMLEFATTKMNIRREPTYLSSDVWKACWLISKTRASEDGRPISTADEIANTILREALEQKYPQIFDHLRKVAKDEKELLKTLT
jgi:hypothetical protein